MTRLKKCFWKVNGFDFLMDDIVNQFKFIFNKKDQDLLVFTKIV